MSGTRPPHCATCDCRDERGRIDVTAPFYDLVLAIDRTFWRETIARREEAKAERRTRELVEVEA